MMPPAHPCTACCHALWLLRDLQNLQKGFCYMVTEAKLKSSNFKTKKSTELSNFGWCCLQRLNDILVIAQK
jgi:hypothetical protein